MIPTALPSRDTSRRMTDLEPPDFLALSRAQQVAWGARYAVRGARIVAGAPSLWGYVLAPVVLMATAFVSGAGLILWLVPIVTGWVWAPGPDTDAGLALLYWIALWTVRLGLVGGLMLGLYLVAGLVATPFNDRLSDQVERRILRTSTEADVTRAQFLRDLFWSVVHSGVSLGIYLVAMGFLLVLNLLPGLGSALSFAGGAVVSAAFFTREAMDGSMSRRRMGYVEKWRLIQRIWPFVLGFGAVVGVAMWVPLLNFLILPMSVAGGTALFCHLERAGQLGRRRTDVVADPAAHG